MVILSELINANSSINTARKMKLSALSAQSFRMNSILQSLVSKCDRTRECYNHCIYRDLSDIASMITTVLSDTNRKRSSSVFWTRPTNIHIDRLIRRGQSVGRTRPIPSRITQGSKASYSNPIRIFRIRIIALSRIILRGTMALLLMLQILVVKIAV